MESKNAFELRDRSLEAQYFVRKDSELIDKLRLIFHKRIDKQSIRDATGVTDEELLDRLVALNLDGELMAAFNLLPLIEVAWADGVVDDPEVRAVFAHGMQPNALSVGAPYAFRSCALRRADRLCVHRRTRITSMIDLVLFDEQSRRVQLDDKIPRAAATALLPFRGVW